MPEPVSVAELKVHLRLDPDETGEDAALEAMITAARSLCETFLDRIIVGNNAETDNGVRAVVAHAIKIACAAWYDDRAGETPTPVAFTALLRPYRRLGVPA